MRRWKLLSVLGAALLFIGLNIFLLLKDDSKAERQAYVSEWSKINNGDVVKTFDSEAVVEAEQKHYVSYDPEEGRPVSFLVEEGDKVTAGMPLFTYETSGLEEEKAELESEILQIGDEISAVETQIDKLETIDAESDINETTTSEKKEEDLNVSVDVTVDVKGVLEGDIQKAIAESEAELERMEAAKASLENELTRVEDKLADVSFLSETDGEIIELDEGLDNPLITIASEAVKGEGLFTEEQIQKAEEGQEVFVHAPMIDKKYKGTLEKISNYPAEAPSLEEEPEYPFAMQLADADDTLLPGAKLSLKIVTAKAEDVPVVKQGSILKDGKKQSVLLLTDKGMVNKKNISTGVSFDGRKEVTKGLKKGNLIVTHPKEVRLSGTSFVTPLQSFRMEKKEIKKLRKKHVAKYILAGFFER